MIVQRLKSYSSERYYLLSEVENRADFLFLDDKDELTTKIFDRKKNYFAAYYALWDTSKISSEEFVKILQEKVNEVKIYTKEAKLVIIIDAFVASEEYFAASLSKPIDEMLFSIIPELSTLLIVGVSNHKVPCPGLEKCHEMLESLRPGYISDDHIAVILGDSPDTFRGMEPEQEPDAVSDVFQALIVRQESSIDEFLMDIKESELYNANFSKYFPSSSFSMKKKETSSEDRKRSRLFSLLPAHHILMIVIVLMFSYLASVYLFPNSK